MRNYAILSTFLFLLTSLITPLRAQDVTTLCATQTGKAAYYGDHLHGRPTASGKTYDKNKLTTAHRTLKFGSLIRVTNLRNNKTVEVVVTDRGPFPKTNEKIIDVSRAAAEAIDMIKDGVIEVKIEVLRVGYNGERCRAQGTGRDASTASLFEEPTSAGQDDLFSPAVQPEKVEIRSRSYAVTERAINYNLWGEQVELKGYGILVSESGKLEDAIQVAVQTYYKDFHQVFILADAPTENTRVFRVIVGRGSKEQALKIGEKLFSKGVRSLSLVKHKEVNKT